MANVLDVQDLVVGGPDGATLRLPHLTLGPGEVAALHGPSGCGKTTLLRALCGLLPPHGWSVAGRVVCRGRDLLAAGGDGRRQLLRHDLAVLPQDAPAALDPLQPVGAWLVQATGRAAADVCAVLGGLGIVDAAALCRRLPHQISGGQAQRVLLAVALLRAPALVVADEPCASLDPDSRALLVDGLRRLVAAGRAVLLATHDEQVLRALGARVFAKDGDRFVPTEVLDAPWPGQPTAVAGGEPILAARGVHHRFGALPVLAGVDLAVARGEVVAIVGASGSGKTTLARILAGRLQPDAGDVVRPAGRTAVQLLAQDAFGSLTPGVPLQHLLGEARAEGFVLPAALRDLSLPAAVLARPRETMSGGERRRAALLRALAVDPAVLVLDEPTASLDRTTARALVALLRSLQAQRGLALVLVTHDLELARALAPRLLSLTGGRLCPA